MASTIAATAQEVGRRAVVDRDDDDAFEQAPQNATIHSGRFSLQIAIAWPLRDAARPQARAANAVRRGASSPYVHVHVR